MRASVRTMAVAAVIAVLAAPALAQNMNLAFSTDAELRTSLRAPLETDPFTIDVPAGGPLDASRTQDTCNGRVSALASFTLRYRAGDRPLIISASSETDTTLLVRAPSGRWFCNDDFSDLDLNPEVRFERPRSGRYQIWVGRYGESIETRRAMLRISETPTPRQSGDQPDASLEPSYGSVDLTAGFSPDPHTREIAAGGDLNASSLGQPGCVGLIARAPDYRVNWTRGSNRRTLIFSVNAEADTTLVIHDANGNWRCDDDSGNEGRNPAIRVENAPSGAYSVWVGTYERARDLPDSVLHISEEYSR